MLTPLFALLFAAPTMEPPPTGLFLRGHSVVPTPQKVSLAAGEVALDESWTIEAPAHIATRTLTAGLKELHAYSLETRKGAPRTIALKVQTGAVTGMDAEVAPQGYRLKIAPNRIEIIGNGDAGLFYGVQTLVQLVKRGPRGALLLPEGAIEDWPRLMLRFLHWDTKHHQDRLPTLKRYLDQAARFKVNMIGFEIEDKFTYPSHPTIGAPGAFTPAEMQEIVDYGLERFIQVVPVVQSPAHMAYVLKHPEYARLKADGNNYQSCLCLEDTYKLIFQMYDDLIAATKGVNYFFVSTDEIYYAGIGANCKEPYNPVNRSLKWAEFATRARNHLAGRGRRMLAWVEYPLLPEHIDRIPADVIDGVMGEEGYFESEKKRGVRQLAYTSMQGAEFLFPDHFPIEPAAADSQLGEFEQVFTPGRLGSTFRSIAEGRVMRANPIGVFGAAWDDSGLHSETFWLGWIAAARWGWHPGTPGVEQHAAEFFHQFYGPGAAGMTEAYRSLQRQARAWQRSWERVTSRVRAPGYGNSDGPGVGTQRSDLTLTPPPLPRPEDLFYEPNFANRYRARLAEARTRALENDQLRHALAANLLTVERNRYNLEVFLALARFIGHQWKLLAALNEAERSMASAAASSRRKEAGRAVGHLVSAYNTVSRAETEGEAEFQNLTAVFEKDRFPKGRTVNGRKFVHVLDDTKDHWADRTPDLGYMFAPEKSLGLPAWRAKLKAIIEDFAARNKVPVRGLAEARLEE
jgi:hypothetical protein